MHTTTWHCDFCRLFLLKLEEAGEDAGHAQRLLAPEDQAIPWPMFTVPVHAEAAEELGHTLRLLAAHPESRPYNAVATEEPGRSVPDTGTGAQLRASETRSEPRGAAVAPSPGLSPSEAPRAGATKSANGGHPERQPMGAPRAPLASTMLVFVRTMLAKQTVVEASPDETVAQFRTGLVWSEPPAALPESTLTVDGRILADGCQTLRDSGVEDGTKVAVSLLPGTPKPRGVQQRKREQRRVEAEATRIRARIAARVEAEATRIAGCALSGGAAWPPAGYGAALPPDGGQQGEACSPCEQLPAARPAEQEFVAALPVAEQRCAAEVRRLVRVMSSSHRGMLAPFSDEPNYRGVDFPNVLCVL